MSTLTSQPSRIVTPVRSQSVNRAPRRSAASTRAPRNRSPPPPSPALNRCGPNCAASSGSPGEAGTEPAGSLVAVIDGKITPAPDDPFPGYGTSSDARGPGPDAAAA